ncbi:MAG: molybdenum cofactor guanylyltransferase [Verrucomicrobiota bacterium]|jgi:molybdopterin-guanine dinucleotide biosynthesis protein A
MIFSAVILAGGRSRRMGRDKAWLPVNGEPLLARQIEMVRQLAPFEIYISGRADTDYSSFCCPVLHDQFTDAGPLAGIERALDAASTPLMLVLAVDLPNMSAPFLRMLAGNCTDRQGVIPRLKGSIEPLVAFYPKYAKTLAEAQLRTSHYAVTAFAERCVQTGLANFHGLSTADAGFFFNWNDNSQPPMAVMAR